MSEDDFVLRRNSWLLLTTVAFLSPTVWLYLAVAVPVLIWCSRKDSNPPAAFAALMFVSPSFLVHIPKVFAVSQWMLLCLCLALPALLHKRYEKGPRIPPLRAPSIGLPVVLLVAYICLQCFPFLQVVTWTEVARKLLVELLNILLPVLFFHRLLRDRKSLHDLMASFVMTCAVLALIGLVESTLSWLLYAGVSGRWGADTNPFGFLMRDGQLRAMASTGHSLSLGITLAVGFAFCLYLRRFGERSRDFLVLIVVMWIGMFAAFSRGPWIAALLMMVIYLWLMPRGAARVLKVVFGILFLAVVLSPTRQGQKILNALPFIGTTDSGNIEYRQQLLDLSLDLIPLNPWFGDILVVGKMQSLRQGQGIVDIVNGYLVIALQFGLVTLGIWLLFVIVPSVRIWRATRLSSRDPDLSAAGYILLGIIAGLMFFTWVAGITITLYVILAIGLAYARIVRAEHAAVRQPVRTAHNSQTGPA